MKKALEKRKPKPSTDHSSTLAWYPQDGGRSHYHPHPSDWARQSGHDWSIRNIYTWRKEVDIKTVQRVSNAIALDESKCK